MYEQFIDSILSNNPSFSGQPAEVYEQLKEDLLSQLEDCINAAILDHIPNHEMATFNQVLDSDSEAQLIAFYQRVIPSLPNIIVREMEIFKSKFVKS